MIRCAMFDFGNVLGIFNTPRWYDFIYQNRGNLLEPHEMFSGSVVDIIREYDLGKLSDAEFYEKIVSAYNMNISQKDFFEMFVGILALDRGMLGIVHGLRNKGVETALITNMNSFHARYVRHNFPEVFGSFDYTMVSCEEGVAKPNPEAWIRILDRTGFKAEECLFIDDSIVNVREASRLGIVSWHYNVTDEKFCMNGKLESERLRFLSYLTWLTSHGMLYSKNI